MGKGVMPFFCIGVISMYTQTERLLLRSPSKEDKGFVKLRVVKLTKDNKITCGHQYPKDVY